MIKTDKVMYKIGAQKEYYWLMKKLEEAGCEWLGGECPSDDDEKWILDVLDYCIWVEKKIISYSEVEFFYDYYKDHLDYEIIEVSDLMENEIKTDKVIYHTKTQEEFNWLMQELERAGCEWMDGRLPTLIGGIVSWEDSRSNTGICLENKKISYSDFDFLKSEPEYDTYEFIEVSDLIGQPYKDTKGKPKLSLVPPQVLFDIAEVREYGNAKYPADGADNWKRVDINDYKDALLRHTMKYIQNPNGKDEESGIEHYKHMACNIAFICEMERKDE